MNPSVADVPASHKPAFTRLIDILVAPRYATSAPTRWTSAGLFVLLAGAAVVIGIISHDPKARFAALICYSFGITMVWWLWFSGLVLIARDGGGLGLPRVGRDSAYAACLYAAAMVAAPALLVAASGGNVAAAVLFPALAIAGSLAWTLLPRWFAMWFGFMPAIYIGLHNAFHVPSPLDPRFRHWAWLALAVLAVMVMFRWRRIARAEDNDDSRWSSAMILQMRRHAVSCDWWSMDRNWVWRRSRARRIDVDFRGIGAANPASAIRVALGDWYVPQSWRSRAATLARVLLPLLLFIPLMVFMTIGRDGSLHKVWKVLGISGGLWVGLFGSAMLALAVAALVQRRWRGSADLGLLALLPGLGGAAATPHVLRAALWGPAIGFIALWACMLAGITRAGRSRGAPGHAVRARNGRADGDGGAAVDGWAGDAVRGEDRDRRGPDRARRFGLHAGVRIAFRFGRDGRGRGAGMAPADRVDGVARMAGMAPAAAPPAPVPGELAAVGGPCDRIDPVSPKCDRRPSSTRRLVRYDPPPGLRGMNA